MYSACPASQRTERSILYSSWLTAALTASEAEEDPLPLTAQQKVEALTQINAMLADDDLIKANIFTVLSSGARLTNALTAEGSDERAELTQKFLQSYDRLAADETLYKRERIYTLRGKMMLERGDDSEAEISGHLKQEIREMVAWADKSTPSVYERQPIINALGNVLFDAGMDEEAQRLLLAELDRSKQPYYYMVSLADIEQRAENFDAAIDWLKKAHDVSKGPATRFQWGSYYLDGLLQMTPDDMQRIHDTTVGLISELQQGSGFYQRPRAQLQRLEESLRTWSEDNDNQVALSEIRNSVLMVCARAEKESESRATCEAFLEAA
jgi:protein disulfide-isomerase